MSTHRVLICAVLLFAGSPVLARDYQIRMIRPAKVAQKYELVASAEESKQMTVSTKGRVVKEEKSSLSATCEGTITVLEFDKLDREVTFRLLVSKCRKRTNGNASEEEVLSKGTQVVVRRRDLKARFLIDGKDVSKDVEEVLFLIFSHSRSQETYDDMFGTKERKKVGDRWAMNSTKAAKVLAPEGLKVDPENVKGSTKIEKLVVVEGTRCLQLSGKMKMELGTVLPRLPPGLPAELAVRKSILSLSFSGAFPVDISIGRLSEKMTMTRAFVAKGKPAPDAPEITLSMKMTKSRQMKRKFLK